mgnify:CR=1 FL=1
MTTSRIVVATDFRTLSDTCVRLGAELGAAFHMETLLLHATDLTELERTAAIPLGMQIAMDALEERLRIRQQKLQALLDSQAETHGSLKGAVCHVRLVDDRPWHAIVQASKEPQTELLIIGSRGKHRSALERTLGTTTERVVHDASKPVLVLHPDAFVPTLMGTHWIVGIDFSPTSLEAATYTAKLAKHTKGTLSLIHVLPFGQGRLEIDLGDQLEQQWTKSAHAELAEIAQRIGGVDHIQVIPSNPELSAGQALCQACEKIDGAVLSISAGSHNTVSRVMLGSTANRCLRHATTPVLVVKNS